MNNINIIIDNREQKIISLLEDKIFIDNNPDFNYNKKNLDIGDFKYSLNDTHIIIERKTVEDLVSSIKDGRYKEQKCRLINEMKNNTKIIYLIEGDIWKCKRFNADTLYSVIINSIIIYIIHIYISKDINHTILFLLKMNKQLIKNKDIIFSNSLNISDKNIYSQYIKSNKKSNITQYTCFINQLSQIPGISYSIGKVIADKYVSMYNFINTLQQNKDEYTILSNLQHGKTNRRIGNKLSEQIKIYIGGL